MQVPGWFDAGPDSLTQVLGCSFAGPLMVSCRSSDVEAKVSGCSYFRDVNAVRESRNTFGGKQCYWLNVWAII